MQSRIRYGVLPRRIKGTTRSKRGGGLKKSGLSERMAKVETQKDDEATVTIGGIEMNIREASRRLEIIESLTYQLCREGRLPHVRIGGRGRRGKIVITEPDLADFLASVRGSQEAVINACARDASEVGL